MRRIRQRNTEPELAVRRYLHSRGLRFILHPRKLPGRPDIVLPRRKTAVFVHGCFWHGHDCDHGRVRAKTNAEFWQAKIAANKVRDQRKKTELERLGWFVETIWECQTEDLQVLRRLAQRLLRR
ncbi:MAG: DNA mismatch endonuclease Vsr [Burkholderiaceae bacterium]|nr:DNA mismatch endonuclease Vsr [Burkholderiaceae bacterium]